VIDTTQPVLLKERLEPANRNLEVWVAAQNPFKETLRETEIPHSGTNENKQAAWLHSSFMVCQARG